MNAAQMTKPYYTVKDLMAVTGLSDDTVTAAIRTGQLPGYRIGRQYRIPADAFDDFLHGRWVPQLRPLFAEPMKPLPKLVHKRTS